MCNSFQMINFLILYNFSRFFTIAQNSEIILLLLGPKKLRLFYHKITNHTNTLNFHGVCAPSKFWVTDRLSLSPPVLIGTRLLWAF